ncbi:S60 ribosomal protein L18a [Heterostelium album PN500]|uniref:60S ribosomal protein L18a n=1 Tax=Heterostelium pallidum (strain ATCC 26659 / Pp 5 / PN500) TaxID=670386 RepID=D3B5J6_HETP5|nr:S60 ribosomal protein L18a [Heterostelium album PN500]EFA83144.1 S60 ribosomal protein L18a [Heterostelium album PN500]|eukprot:XP_020435261.1 S60 ribosomal protein L18a [Heterostelium album PN500]
MPFHEFQVVGRHVPTEREAHPKLFRMRLFAKTSVHAKSRFWYFLSKIQKMKKATGEILNVTEIFEEKPLQVKNFGIFIRYNSRSGTHNIYKEYRDTTRVGAVAQMYDEMASRHSAREKTIHIIEIKEIKAAQARRANTKQFHDSAIRFPLTHRVPRKLPQFKSTFKASKPKTF